MKPPMVLSYELVKTIPNELEERMLYVSMECATVVHKCCCGCGREVVTPLSPTDWKMTYDGESISLSPSVGNWSFECRSHYWIRQSRVTWAGRWSEEQIEAGRRYDRKTKEAHYTTASTVQVSRHDWSVKRFWSWLSKLRSR